MLVEYIENDFKPGTTYRRVFLYYDNGDAIMTDGDIYEDDFPDEDEDEELDEDEDYEGPEDG